MATVSVSVMFRAAAGNIASVVGSVRSSISSLSSTVSAVSRSFTALSSSVTRSLTSIASATVRATTAVSAYGSTVTSVMRGAVSKATSVLGAFGRALGTATTSMVKFTSTAVTGLVRGLGSLGGGLTKSNREFANQIPILNTSAAAYKGLVGQVANLNRFMNALFSSIRQVGQGLQNFGVVFSLFISTPIAGIFTKIISEAVEFDDQMIETQKTTGLLRDELQGLKKDITGISLEIPVSRLDLAKIAADWGRIGVTNPDALASLTKTTAKVDISTDLEAEDIVTKFGRIGTLLYRGVEGFTKFVETDFERMASVVNVLGADNPIGEQEVLETAMRLAPMAGVMGFNVPQLFGISASLASTNVSSERAGTQGSSALSSMVKKYDDLAAILSVTNDEVKTMIDTDAAQFFLDVASAISKVESATERARLSDEIFGTVGGKSANSLIANLPEVGKNIDLATRAFEDGTSVQVEFERAMNSTKSQIELLGNNLTYLGSVFGEVVLPYITKFVLMAVPALQMAARYFEGMTESSKLWTVGLLGLMAILGPAIIMLGTFMFSLGIIGTGISTMIANVLLGIASIGKFVLTIIGFIRPFSLLTIAIAGVGAAAIYLASQMQTTSGVLAEFMSGMFEWGYNLFKSFGDGMLAAAGYVQQAVLAVINTFVRFLQSFSPPKEGPLSNIDTWGKNVMQTFVDSMAEVDVSGVIKGVMRVSESLRDSLSGLSPENLDLFSSIWSEMGGILRSLGSHFSEIEDFDINTWLERAANGLVDFFNTIQDGGNASLGGLSDLLGGFTGDFERLVELENKYVKANQELEKVKEAIKNIDKDTEDQIARIASNTSMTVDERSAAIRAAKLNSSQRKEDLEEQQDALEEEKDAAKDALDAQKQLINILSSLIPTAKQGKKPEEDEFAGSLADVFDPGNLETAPINENLFELDENFKNFTTRLEEAKDKIDGFFKGLMGHANTIDEWINSSPAFKEGFMFGSWIRNDVLEFFDNLNKKVDTLKGHITYITGLKDILSAGVVGGYLGLTLTDEEFSKFDGLQQIVYKIGEAFGYATSEATIFLDLIKGPTSAIRDAFDTALQQSKGKGFAGFVAEFDFELVGVKLGEIFNEFFNRYFGEIDTTVFSEFFGGIADALLNFINTVDLTSVKDLFVSIINGIIEAFTGTGEVVNIDPSLFGSIANRIVQGIFDAISAIKFSEFASYAVWILGSILEGIATVDASGVGEELLNVLKSIVFGIANIDMKTVGTGLGDIINNLLAGLGDKSLWEGIGSGFANLVNGVAALIEAIDWSILPATFEGLETAILTAITEIDWGAVGTAIISALLEGLINPIIVDPFSGWLRDNNSMDIVDEAISRGQQRNSNGVNTGGGGGGSGDYFTENEGSQTKQPENKDGWGWLWNFLGFNSEQDATATTTSVGKDLATNVATSMSDTISSPESISTGGFGVSSFATSVGDATEEDMVALGSRSGGAVISGFGNEFTKTPVVTPEYDKITQSMTDWHSRSTRDLADVGEDISQSVIRGFTEGSNDGTKWLGTLPNVLSSWLGDVSNQEQIKLVGFSLGIKLLEGLGEAISKGADYVWKQIGVMLGAETATPQEIALLLPKNPYVPVTPPTTEQGQGASISSMMFDVNINGGSLSDRNTVEYIINEVYKRLSRDIRLART